MQAALFVAAGLALAAGAPAIGAERLIGGEATYPRPAARAASAQGFVPAGWEIEARAEGDLDRDGIGDLALVLREKNPAHIVQHDGLGENPLDTNPRMLVVALRERQGGYRLAVENHSLIPRRQNPVLEDPFDTLTIVSGVLRVKLRIWMSAGSWSASNLDFAFRLQQGGLMLIGYDHQSIQRNTGKLDEYSLNYLTRRAKISIFDVDNDAEKARWKTLPRRPLRDIVELGDGLAFDPGWEWLDR